MMRAPDQDLMNEELMPLPSDEKIVQLANDLLAQFDTIFGLHPGFRPAHAKGMMLSGTFARSPEARSSNSRATRYARIYCCNRAILQRNRSSLNSR
jgi:hypothetical protein